MSPSRSEFINLRHLRYHVRHWGPAGAPKIFMLHGWMDVSATFQFVVDALQREWHVIAPDWRGFGLTDATPFGSYWYPDYLADLDALLAHYSSDEATALIGHSMGGNVAMIYAGVQPQKVAKLVNLEGFGLPPMPPQMAPQRYAEWLEEERQPPILGAYPSSEAVVARLRKNNPRLSEERAVFLASHWAVPSADGRWHILADPAHKRVNPILYRVEETLACWSQIAAPVLWVEADHPHFLKWSADREAARREVDNRVAIIPEVRREIVVDAGHMLHHDQPKAVAELIESFLVA